MFYWCRSGIWKLKCGAEVWSSQTNYMALGERWGHERKEGKETQAFLPNKSPISLGNFAPRLVPGSRTEYLAWVKALIFPIFLLFSPFLVTTSWEQTNGSRVACCQYRLQKSVSSQTGSEIGGGTYRFLRLFLVSFSELVWFRLVRYYFELGWDKHIPLVYQMLSAASQFPEAPGLTFLGAQECPGRG